MKIPQTREFHPNPYLLEKIEEQGWTLFANGDEPGSRVLILASAKLLNIYADGRAVWEALTKIGNAWLRLRAMARSGCPIVTFHLRLVYGDTSLEAPTFEREDIGLQSEFHPMVDAQIERWSDQRIMHGQGTTVQRFEIDFQNLTVTRGVEDPDDFLRPNPYCPPNPNQTGGLWPYMGITHEEAPLPNLYMLGGYGGYFQHHDDGRLVTEADYPDLQTHGAIIHSKSKDRGWIRYTNPDEPWRDRMAVFENQQDQQHYCLFSPLAQTSILHHEDEGLHMLLEAAAHVFMRDNPAVPRGTAHANSPTERGQGRILKTGVDLYRALMSHGDIDLANMVGTRTWERWLIDKAAFKQRFNEHGIGFARWGGDNLHYSASEIGIHFWGVWVLAQAIKSFTVLIAPTPEELEAVQWWLEEAADWLFASFRFEDGRWGVPYFEDREHRTPNEGLASSPHFAWLGATKHKPRDADEEAKMQGIVAIGEHMEMRFKR
jgi:hypothetical protein